MIHSFICPLLSPFNKYFLEYLCVRWCAKYCRYSIDLNRHSFYQKIVHGLVGCIPQACMPCNCLAESLEKEPRTVTETSMGYWAETLTSLNQSPRMTAHCVQPLADRTQQQCSLLGREKGGVRRRLPVTGGMDISLAYQLSGRPEAGAGAVHVGSY